MTAAVITAVAIGILCAVIFAIKYGKKSSQLSEAQKRLKEQAERYYRAQQTLSTYVNMPRHELNRRMRKKRKAAIKRMRSKN